MPAEGIWACINGEAYHGKLSIDSLRAITGNTEKERVIFVEDEFAKDWLEDMLRQHKVSAFASTEVHAAGGFPYVVDVTMHHNKNPAVTKQAIAVVDGDAQIEASTEVLKFPGEIPENEIFGYVRENAEKLSGLVQQRCLCPNMTQDAIIKAINAASLDTNDPHLLFRKTAENLGFLSEIIVRKGFISIYNDKNASAIGKLADQVAAFIEG